MAFETEKGSRILLAAPKSGSGKTLLTCGLLQALNKRGLSARAYKCGPDYIDPMFHRSVLGVESENLDSYFSGREEIRRRVKKECRSWDITVIEGVMGYYDGLGGSLRASTYEIAAITQTPVILVIDGKGMSLSMGAVVKGFREFQKDSGIAGVIANRTSPMMAKRLKEWVEKEGVAFLGCLPENPEWNWKSRRLGLVMPDELEDIQKALDRLAEGMERYLDIDGLLKIAEGRENLKDSSKEDGGKEDGGKEDGGRERWREKEPLRIAVARDEAFCFYYEENLRLLKDMGAELVFFSPLHSPCLPEETDGILIGGGYPELYASSLSENQSMREAVRRAAKGGMPVLGECGGFLYLQQELEGEDGKGYPMAGVLEGKGIRTKKLVRFGYGEFVAGGDSMCLKEGETIRGHEFHYWDSTDNGQVFQAHKPAGGQTWACIRREGNTEAGFPHFYYPSAPSYAERWLEKCREYRRSRKKREKAGREREKEKREE